MLHEPLQAGVGGTAGGNRHCLPDELMVLCAEELRKRLPLLLAAIAAEDCAAAHTEAHAMKGVAANFGLVGLAECLNRLDAAARAGRLAQLHADSAWLPAELNQALGRFGDVAA